MAKRKTFRDGNLLWRSEHFPELVFTDVMLESFRKAYPFVPQFQPELEKCEAWLLTNPDRQPRSGWGRFVNNWMRNANKWNLETAQKKFPRTTTESKRRHKTMWITAYCFEDNGRMKHYCYLKTDDGRFIAESIGSSFLRAFVSTYLKLLTMIRNAA